MAQLYNELPNQWLLLEIKKKDKAGRAEKLLLLKNDPDKNRLYDYLMEEDINWDWNKNYIFVYSDPDKACDLI